MGNKWRREGEEYGRNKVVGREGGGGDVRHALKSDDAYWMDIRKG